MRVPTILLGLTFFVSLISLAARADVAPSFLIESITVEGGSRASDSIVVAESHLRAGQTYEEAQLRDAMARVQRLPFVVSTDFRLAKGSSIGKYVLVISIKQMKPLFATAAWNTRWTLADVFENRPTGRINVGTEVSQLRTNNLVLGARAFIGAKGVLNLAAERVERRNDRYTLSFSEYDLFGTSASITAVVSYLRDPGARRTADPEARYDWHHRDNLTYELIGILPIGENDSLRGSWERSERPIAYLEILPETPQRVRPALRSLPQIRTELFWIHDTTNDPLFPTSGTRLTAGAARTSTPTSGFTNIGRVKIDELLATLEHSWSFTSAQAMTLGGSGLDYDRNLHKYRVFGRYSIDVWGREKTLRNGDLRLELGVDRIFSRIRTGPYSADSTVRVGLAWRNVWGVLRLDAEYNSWRQP